MPELPIPPDPSTPDTLDRLLAVVRGECTPEEAARLRADPRHGGEIRALEGLFGAMRSSFDPAPDPAAGARVAARVRQQVHAEETRAHPARRATPVPRRLFWVRILAGSLAAHAVVIGVLASREHPTTPVSGDDGRRLAHLFPQMPMETDEQTPIDLPSFEAPTLASTEVFRDPIVPDLPVTVGSESSPDVPLSLPEMRERVREFPSGIGIEMLARTDEVFKRKRLAHLELDPDGTLRRVRRGLDALAHAQNQDGSWAEGDGRSVLAQTALAVLPFLGDGRGSRSADPRSETTARAVAWIRARTHSHAEAPAGETAADGEDGPGDLGVALAALSEDYMVSYGRFSPAEAEQRAGELRSLVARIVRLQGKDGSFTGTGDSPGAPSDIAQSNTALWAMWGLDAAARTGAALPPAETAERFARWFGERTRTEDGVPRRSDGAPDRVLAATGLLFSRDLGAGFAPSATRQASWAARAGLPSDAGPGVADIDLAASHSALYIAAVTTGLLRHDPATFKAWNKESGPGIVARLDPTGVARHGDPVGDTALLLLALQAAYRAY